MKKINYKDKVEGCLLISSFLDTIGYFNGKWEFNFANEINNVREGVLMNSIFIQQYEMMGGIENFDLEILSSSDDTILIIGTAHAVLNGGGEKNYINEYLNRHNLLKEQKRQTGLVVLSSLEKLRTNRSMKAISYSTNHGGNGCAIRTAPIGLKYYQDIEKTCEEALIASLITHNHPIGYIGGIITALFTAYAVLNINPFEWSIKLIELYKKNFFHKLIRKYNDYEKLDEEINEYFIYWEKYNELRLSKMKHRNLPIFLNPSYKFTDLLKYSNVNYLEKMKGFDKLGASGLESVILAYDNLLLSTIPDKKMNVDTENPRFSWRTLFYNNVFFFGDNDSVGAISGSWFGALNGIDEFPIEKIKELEFFQELNKIIKKF